MRALLEAFSPRARRTKSNATIGSNGRSTGFNIVPEKEVLLVEPQNIAPFSLPQEALSFSPSQEETVFTFKKGGSERKLHCNTELTEEEIDKLELLQADAEAKGCVFFPSIAVAATRYLGHVKGDCQKALAMMQATQDWRQSYYSLPLRDTDLIEDLQHGIIYFVGRDCSLRPTLVFRARRIPIAWQKAKNFDGVIKLTLFCVEYFLRYMIVPGRVECFNVLVDLKDIAVTQIPVAGLKELNDKLGGHYVGRGGKFFICNMSRWLSPLVSVCKGVLSERRSQKLVFIDNVQELRSHFALHQLEEDLGGSMPVVDSFFPFPLQPGPFDAGYAGGPRADAVAGVHDVFTAAGARGRLWKRSRTCEQNTSLEYSRKAALILETCGLAVPLESMSLTKLPIETVGKISFGFQEERGLESPSTCAGNVVEESRTTNFTSIVFNGQVLLSYNTKPLKIIILL
mmetsp:Transcript_75547/g.119283  ORF Transcript_75547/g.119283 Transcript_75547/m.119283 type:complete len:456 (+) Transcript_75547:163-1530(+)